MDTKKPSLRDLIITALKDKACTKQKIYQNTVEVFNNLKVILKEIAEDLEKEMQIVDKSVGINYMDKGEFEAEIKFGGDILIFSMHTNVFYIEEPHFIHNTKYVKQDSSLAYCGMIQVFNFLADSLKYNRYQDIGYMVGRLFVNKENHFFVEGKRQLGYLYNDFSKLVLDKEHIKAVIESAILYTINFDLLTPPYEEVKQITLLQKIEQRDANAMKTGKRLGFKFQADTDYIA